MSADAVIDLARSALQFCFTLAGPVLATVVAIGVILGILQTATQVHDPTISFAGRLFGAALIVILALPWMLSRLTEYAGDLIRSIPQRL